MRTAPREPTLTRDLATLADLYFTLAWNVGRQAFRPKPRQAVRRRRSQRVEAAVPGDRNDDFWPRDFVP